MNRIFAILFTTVCCVVIIPLIAMAISDGDYLRLAVIAGVTICLPLLLLSQTLAALTFSVWLSGFLIPGTGAKLTIFYGLVIILLAAVLGRITFKVSSSFTWSSSHTWLLLFVASFIPVIAVHGIGLKIFGSSAWGGFSYVQLFLSAGFLLAAPAIPLTTRTWRVVLFFLAAFAIFPAIADVLATLGMLTNFVANFIQTSSQIGMSEVAMRSDIGVVRIYSLSPLALACLLACYSRMDIQNNYVAHRTWFLFLAGLAVLISLPSGGRVFTLQIGLVALFILWQTRTLDRKVVLQFFAAAMLGYLFLFVFARYLPGGVQRAVSFLPFLDLDAMAAENAADSVSWRILLWGEALKTLPDHWLIGKGFVFTGVELERLMWYQFSDDIAWALVASAYHNGHLSLLLGLGVGGYVTGIGVLVSFFIRHTRIQRIEWADPELKKFHLLFFAYFAVQALTYVTLYGDVIGTYSSIFCTLAFVESFYQSDLAYREEIGGGPVSDDLEPIDEPESTYAA